MPHRTMTGPRLLLALLAGWLLPSAVAALELPVWLKKLRPQATVARSEAPARKALAIGEFSGATGASARLRLAQEFKRSEALHLTAETSDYIVSGSSTGGRVQGRLNRADGKTLLERTYAAPGLDENLRAFADDVILAVTGRPGLATSRIAFVSDRSGSQQIYLLDFGSREVQQVTQQKHGAVAPAIAPDGSMLAYTSYETGFPTVQALDLGQGWERPVSDTPGSSFGAAFSPDARRLALVMSFLGNPEIFITDLSSNTASCISDSTGVAGSPTWHPSGRQVLFADDHGLGAQFYVADLPESANGEARLSPWRTGYRFSTDPEFSPDGRQIAFTVRSRRGGSAVVVKAYPMGGSSRVVQSGGARHPTWSPDGRWLCYVQHGALYVHDLRTGERQVILSGYGSLSEPQWMR